MKEEKIPKGAMRFVETNAECFAIAEKLAEDQPPKLKMVGYSGGIIKGHWYWGDLAIDLKGMSFPLSKYPVLEDHDTERKIAFTGKPITSNGKLELDPEKSQFLDTDVSLEFQKNSLAGFPYQSSIYARPSVVERLEEGAKAEVNGMKVKGPMSIWRESTFKECSACVFGWDSKTQASAFSKDEMEDVELEYIDKGGEEETNSDDKNKQSQNEEEVIDLKTIEELKEKYPELVKKLTDEVTSGLEAKFVVDKAALEATISGQATKLSDQEDRMLKLEKDNAIDKDEKFKAKADGIWDSKLSKSQIDEYLFEKAKNQVTHSKFVVNDIFDEVAFSAAVDVEIKDWEDKKPQSSVRGFAVTGKESTNGESNEKQAKEDADVANELLSLAGQKTE